MNNSVVLSLDLELSGDNFIKNGIVSIGASIMDAELNEITHFQRNASLSSDRCYDPITVAEFWQKFPDIFAFIQTNQVSEETMVTQFNSFLKDAEQKYGKNLLVIADVESDIEWMDIYLQKYNYPRLHCNRDSSWAKDRTLITDSYFQALKDLGIVTKTPKSTKYVHDHNPLNDARELVDAFLISRKVLSKMEVYNRADWNYFYSSFSSIASEKSQVPPSM